MAADTEDLLVDGAIDQTFAFQRSQFVPLSAAKVELSDKFESTSPELFFLQSLQAAAQSRTGGDLSAMVGPDPKYLSMLQQLSQYYS